MARRGYSLEGQINRLIDWVNDNGGHGHKNHAERTVDGVFVRGEAFDYEIFYKNRLMVFDAKECAGAKWALSNAKLTQVKHLMNCKINGLDAFFLVYFHSYKKLIKFDVTMVQEAMAQGVKALSPDAGEVFKNDF